MSRFKQFVTALVVTSSALAASSAAANARPGQGYERNFTDHQKGTPCEEIFINHPYIDGREFRVVSSFKANGSYYASRYHNRNLMSSGNKYHECDATVIAYNGLPNGTILRVRNPLNGKVVIAVVQDKGGPDVDRRPDLSRGLIELLGDGPAEDVGLLKGLIYEVLEPTS